MGSLQQCESTSLAAFCTTEISTNKTQRCRYEHLDSSYCKNYCKNYICTEYQVSLSIPYRLMSRNMYQPLLQGLQRPVRIKQCVRSKRDIPITAAIEDPKPDLMVLETVKTEGTPTIKTRDAAVDIVAPVSPGVDCQYLWGSCNNAKSSKA